MGGFNKGKLINFHDFARIILKALAELKDFMELKAFISILINFTENKRHSL